jgi:hypothetical protein
MAETNLWLMEKLFIVDGSYAAADHRSNPTRAQVQFTKAQQNTASPGEKTSGYVRPQLLSCGLPRPSRGTLAAMLLLLILLAALVVLGVVLAVVVIKWLFIVAIVAA